MAEKRLFDFFDDLVEQELPTSHNSLKEAFHKVNDDMAEKMFRPYKSYQSYKSQRCRRKNKRG